MAGHSQTQSRARRNVVSSRNALDELAYLKEAKNSVTVTTALHHRLAEEITDQMRKPMIREAFVFEPGLYELVLDSEKR
jgi:hypothetical protein